MRHSPNCDSLGPRLQAGLGALALGACLFFISPIAFSAESGTGKLGQEVSLSVLSSLEARTIQINPDLPMLVQLEGNAFGGQVVFLEQKGLVIYEQQLKEGPFRIKALPPLDNTSPLTVRLQSPNQAEERTILTMQPNQRRELFAKRPELFALAPAAKPVPLKDKLPLSKMEEDIEFDVDFLRGKAFRNLSPAEVKKLGSVRPGNIDTDIFRNGSMVSKGMVRFVAKNKDESANACISPALFQQLGVKPNFISPKGIELMKAQQNAGNSATAGAPSAPDCLFMEDWVVGAATEFDSSTLRLDVSIPQAFLTRQNRQSVPPEMLTRGENAGFINYNLNNYSAKGFSSNYLGLNTGLNVAGWQVRHTSYLSQNRSTGGGTTNSTSQYVAGETYVKRPLIDLKANLALGDISSNSPIIGSTPIRGVRLSSEENMLPDDERSFRPVIKGVARTNARVRISQNNTVFFEQTVPPGPFEFDDINPVSSVGNLTVVIAEADGTQQTFTVPFSAGAGKLNPGSYRYSVATGLYRNFTNTQDTAVLQAYLRYGFNDFTTPGMEVLLGPTLPTFVTQTCALIVPSTLKVRTARLDEFVVRGWFGSIEAVGSSFDIRITCASASSSFTPKVTLAYGEGVPCQPGNGGGPDPQAKGIGFAIKTSVTGNKQSDYICGNSASGTNFVSFPATIANESYDQRKTLFVNYAIQSFPTSNGNVHSRVTLTAAFP